MPVLPIIDLLIVLGWTSLLLGGVLKAIRSATAYSPTFFTFSPTDLLIIAAVFLAFALTLAARTWVKLNEPELLASRRAADTLDALARSRVAGAEEARRTELELSTVGQEKAARS